MRGAFACEFQADSSLLAHAGPHGVIDFHFERQRERQLRTRFGIGRGKLLTAVRLEHNEALRSNVVQLSPSLDLSHRSKTGCIEGTQKSMLCVGVVDNR